MSLKYLKTRINNIKNDITHLESIIDLIESNKLIIPKSELGDIDDTSFYQAWCFDNNILIKTIYRSDLFNSEDFKKEREASVKELYLRVPNAFFEFKNEEDALQFKLRFS